MKMDSILSTCNNYFEQFTLSVLRKGKVPRHVGFILDGNRRYARKAGAASTKFGHYEGFKQLEKVSLLYLAETVVTWTLSHEH